MNNRYVTLAHINRDGTCEIPEAVTAGAGSNCWFLFWEEIHELVCLLLQEMQRDCLGFRELDVNGVWWPRASCFPGDGQMM